MTCVLDAALVTVSFAEAVEAFSLLSPAYDTASVWVPTARVFGSVSDALPAPSRVGVPSVVAPSLTVTLPVAVDEPPTVTESLTEAP